MTPKQALARMKRKTTSTAHRFDIGPNDSRPPNGLPLFWWRSAGRQNFGDALSPLIVSTLCEKKTRLTTESPKLVAVGSILKFAKAGDSVWGSGFSRGDQTCEYGTKVFAVRGPHTRKVLLSNRIACPQVYGDPALLLPYLFEIAEPTKKYEVGVIPHFIDYEDAKKKLRHPTLHAMDPAVHLIDILDPIPHIINGLASCKLIYSSSLHGVIVGEALGVPTVWVEFSDNVIGGGWKFHDYYASTGRVMKPLDWRRRITWHGKPPTIAMPDLDALYRSFPLLPAGSPSLRTRTKLSL